MDNLWTRRSNSSKLSLSTPSSQANGTSNSQNDHPTRNYTLSRKYGGGGDSSNSNSTSSATAHGKPNPFNLASPASAASIASPTSGSGASSAFGLGSGAFASFGASKTPKSPGNALDFGSVAGARTPGPEKGGKESSVAGLTRGVGPKESSASLRETKSSQSASAAVAAAAATAATAAATTAAAPSHPLQHGWVFWFRPPISKANGFVEYEKTLHAMAGFSTVEDFFVVYRHLKRPSSLPLVSDYHIFKNGIRPVWEDDENKKGGKWIVRLKKGVADRYWEDLVFAIVGDQFAEASEEVCGAVLSVRNGEDILSIWTRNDGGRVLKIRETMKRVLSFPPDTKVEWKSHDSSIQQRTAIDDARKEKSGGNAGHHAEKRSVGKDDQLFERKQ